MPGGPAGLAAQIEPATDADLEGVLDLWARERSLAANTPDTLGGLRELVVTDPGALIVARDAGAALLGVVVAGWDGWRAVIHRLAVEPGARRGGVGRALVGAAELRFARRGAAKVSIHVGHCDHAALAFWRALGYCVDDEVVRLTRPLDRENPA